MAIPKGATHYGFGCYHKLNKHGRLLIWTGLSWRLSQKTINEVDTLAIQAKKDAQPVPRGKFKTAPRLYSNDKR